MSAVTLERRAAVLIITLDRPKANAIDVATSLDLYAAFKTLNDDPALRVVIITGTGRFFSAGWDLGAANDGEAVDADHGPGGFAGLTEYFSLTKPVIAAVNGLAVGGGCELALAADLIVASNAARFWLPHRSNAMACRWPSSSAKSAVTSRWRASQVTAAAPCGDAGPSPR